MVRIGSAPPELCTALSLTCIKYGAFGMKWSQKSCGLIMVIRSSRRIGMRAVSVSMNEDSAPEVIKLKVSFF